MELLTFSLKTSMFEAFGPFFQAWIVKASSDLSLAAESLSPPVPELGSTATAALERRGTATGLCRNGRPGWKRPHKVRFWGKSSGK